MQKKILIVDDDWGICHSLAMLLRGEGYRVDETTDSGTAAVLIKKENYDVCFFDYKMNGLNGKELSRMVKEIDPRCSAFIISGMMDIEELCRKEINAGWTDGIISKPFDVEELLQKIAAVVK